MTKRKNLNELTKGEVFALLDASIDRLFEKDKILLNRSYNINERTVSHRLAIHIQSVLNNPELDVDIEYNRMQEEYGEGQDVGNAIAKRFNWEKAGEGEGYVYPDIIVHKRETPLNIVEIEVKMAWKNGKKKYDYEKINEYLSILNYQHGVYVEIANKRKDCLIEFGPFDLSKEILG